MSANKDDQDLKERIETYEKNRNDLVTHRLEAMKLYEGLLTSINLGSFGISLAYVFKLVDLRTLKHPVLIITGWTFMGVALFCGLLGHKHSIANMSKMIEAMNEEYYNFPGNKSANSKNQSNVETLKRDREVKYLSNIQFVATVLSVVIMLLFVTLNIIDFNRLIILEGVIE